MKAAGGLEGADPTDLAGLREAEGLADPEGKPAPIGMSRVEIGSGVLSLLPWDSCAAARVPDERNC